MARWHPVAGWARAHAAGPPRQPGERMNRRTLLLLTLWTAASGVAAAAETLKPFQGTYTVVWHSMNAGTMELDLKLDSDGRYTYTSRANARGLFRAFFSEEITQTSSFTLSDAGVRPARYRGDDGTDEKERDISLDFDWTADRVTGVAEEH